MTVSQFTISASIFLNKSVNTNLYFLINQLTQIYIYPKHAFLLKILYIISHNKFGE